MCLLQNFSCTGSFLDPANYDWDNLESSNWPHRSIIQCFCWVKGPNPARGPYFIVEQIGTYYFITLSTKNDNKMISFMLRRVI